MLRRGGNADLAELARARLEECAALLRAITDRKLDVAKENAERAVRRAIPVAAAGTALRSPR